MREDKKKGLRLEQTTAAQWVKSEGWDCIAHHLEEEALLHHIVDMGVGAKLHGRTVSVTGENPYWQQVMLPGSQVTWRQTGLQIYPENQKKLGMPTRHVE